MSFNLSYSLT